MVSSTTTGSYSERRERERERERDVLKGERRRRRGVDVEREGREERERGSCDAHYIWFRFTRKTEQRRLMGPRCSYAQFEEFPFSARVSSRDIAITARQREREKEREGGRELKRGGDTTCALSPIDQALIGFRAPTCTGPSESVKLFGKKVNITARGRDSGEKRERGGGVERQQPQESTRAHHRTGSAAASESPFGIMVEMHCGGAVVLSNAIPACFVMKNAA